jgi:hypothetical protein
MFTCCLDGPYTGTAIITTQADFAAHSRRFADSTHIEAHVLQSAATVQPREPSWTLQQVRPTPSRSTSKPLDSSAWVCLCSRHQHPQSATHDMQSHACSSHRVAQPQHTFAHVALHTKAGCAPYNKVHRGCLHCILPVRYVCHRQVGPVVRRARV